MHTLQGLSGRQESMLDIDISRDWRHASHLLKGVLEAVSLMGPAKACGTHMNHMCLFVYLCCQILLDGVMGRGPDEFINIDVDHPVRCVAVMPGAVSGVLGPALVVGQTLPAGGMNSDVLPAVFPVQGLQQADIVCGEVIIDGKVRESLDAVELNPLNQVRDLILEMDAGSDPKLLG